MAKGNGKDSTKIEEKGGETLMELMAVVTDTVSVKLTEAQARFYHESELDGVVFKELVDAEFTERAAIVASSLDEELLSLMGSWEKNLFRTVLRKWRAEYDSNLLRLEDIDIAELDKIAGTIDIAAHEKAVTDIPKAIEQLVKSYKASRIVLAGVYNELTGRELKAVAFPRATSLFPLRADVLEHIS